ncbi:MAG: PDZ domain-containing protein [Candidatus Gastranaerophilales bacterium]|nr:PDZ domain-containing protein [Candidatus Gastranaerophilales bacterium]
MNNFKFVLTALLLIAVLGAIDTAYVNQSLSRFKMSMIYRDRPVVIGVGVEETGNALKIKDVVHGTPAHQAGVLHSDTLVSVNNVKISSARRLQDVLGNLSNEERIILGIIREGSSDITYVPLNIVRAEL